MMNCKKCGQEIADGLNVCPACGAAVNESAPEQNSQANNFSEKFEALNNTPDTTGDFDAADIEKNKVMAVLAYIIFLIPLLAAKDSPFAKFHTNQGLVLFLVAIISSVVAVIPIIGWIVTSLMSIVITILAIIGIINAIGGKAKELPVIGKFKILK